MESKKRISEVFFYLAYIIWVSFNIINQTYYTEIVDFSDVFNYMRIIIYLLLFMKFILDDIYSIKTILAGIILLLIFKVALNTGLVNILDTFLFIYSARNLEFKKIIKVTLILNIILMSCIVGSSMVGIIKNDIWYREDYSIRYGLGYKYTTFIANYFFHMVLMYIYINGKKALSSIGVIVIYIINYIIYYFTDTRAIFYLTTLILVIELILKIKKTDMKVNKGWSIITQLSFPVCMIVSIFLTITYNGSNVIYNMLNNALTGRLALGKSAYEQFSISLLGKNIKWITGRVGIEMGFIDTYNYVDCAYLNILINYGVIVLLILCIGFMFIGKGVKEKNTCIVIIFLAIHSITDPQLIELMYNPFLLLLGEFLRYRIKINKKRKRIKIIY